MDSYSKLHGVATSYIDSKMRNANPAGPSIDRPCKNYKGMQENLLIELSSVARTFNRLQTAVVAITRAQSLQKDVDQQMKIEKEFGKVLWAQKEHTMAIQAYRKVFEYYNATSPEVHSPDRDHAHAQIASSLVGDLQLC